MDTINPIIRNFDTNANRTTLSVDNVDVSVINALRRTMLSDIPTVVFRGFPNNKNNISITKNTSRFNNEYLKHRISCIPIHKSDVLTFPSFIQDKKVVLHMENDTSTKMYVTTQHLKIQDLKTGQFLSDSETKKIFPPDTLTGDYIIITILYPNLNKASEKNEEIHVEAALDIGTSSENSAWNVVHHVAYENAKDDEKVKQHADRIEDDYAKKDFLALDAQRMFKKNCFHFSFESIGIFDNRELLKMTCDIVGRKLDLIKQYVSTRTTIKTLSEYEESKISTHVSSQSGSPDSEGRMAAASADEESVVNPQSQYCALYTEDGFLVFKLYRDDFTIGKIIEKYLMIHHGTRLEYVGFKKEHPTKHEAFIYIKFRQEEYGTNDAVRAMFEDVCNKAISTISQIASVTGPRM